VPRANELDTVEVGLELVDLVDSQTDLVEDPSIADHLQPIP
jgi:hypothetical protein